MIDYKKIGHECLDHLTALNPKGGIKAFILLAVEFGYKRAVKDSEDKIKELKELAIAYKCALEYDNCPEPTEVDTILDSILIYDREELITILNTYCGWSTGDIESTTFMKLELL